MNVGFYVKIFVLLASFNGYSRLVADIVILPSATNYSNGVLTLTVGTSATLDLFVYSTDGTMVDAMNLFLEVYDGTTLASGPSAPTLGSIQLTSTDFLFEGGGSVNDVGAGTTQREIDAFFLLPNQTNIGSSATQLATIDVNANYAPGTYTLRFDTAGGSGTTGIPVSDTHFVLGGANNFPMINIGTEEFENLVSLADGITIQIEAVPEPTAFVLLGLLCVAGAFRSQRYQ